MMEKIDQISSSMMENGMYEYFGSLLEFKQNLLLRNSDVYEGYEFNVKDDFIRPFTMEQLKRPIELILFFYGLAILIFLIEIIVHKWNMWRNSMQFGTQF